MVHSANNVNIIIGIISMSISMIIIWHFTKVYFIYRYHPSNMPGHPCTALNTLRTFVGWLRSWGVIWVYYLFLFPLVLGKCS